MNDRPVTDEALTPKEEGPRDLALPMVEDVRPWPARGARSLTLFVCVNRRDPGVAVSCSPRGGEDVAVALETAIAQGGLNVQFRRAYCLAACMRGPNIKMMPSGTRLHGVHVSDIPRVVQIVAEQLAERDAVRGSRSSAVSPIDDPARADEPQADAGSNVSKPA